MSLSVKLCCCTTFDFHELGLTGDCAKGRGEAVTVSDERCSVDGMMLEMSPIGGTVQCVRVEAAGNLGVRA